MLFPVSFNFCHQILILMLKLILNSDFESDAVLQIPWTEDSLHCRCARLQIHWIADSLDCSLADLQIHCRFVALQIHCGFAGLQFHWVAVSLDCGFARLQIRWNFHRSMRCKLSLNCRFAAMHIRWTLHWNLRCTFVRTPTQGFHSRPPVVRQDSHSGHPPDRHKLQQILRFP